MENKPYTFQSGKYRDKTVEEIVFKDLGYIGALLSYRDNNKSPSNALQQHLEVLMNTTPETVSKCPICHQESVKYFLYLNTETVSKDLICCDSPTCKQRLHDNHPNDYLLPLKLSSLLVFKQKTLRNKAVSLFKNILGLRGQLSSEKIYSIFF